MMNLPELDRVLDLLLHENNLHNRKHNERMYINHQPYFVRSNQREMKLSMEMIFFRIYIVFFL